MKTKIIVNRHLNLVLYFILISNFSCEQFAEKVYSIKIQNNSSSIIYVTSGFDSYGINSFPDTLLPVVKPELIKVDINVFNWIDSKFKWKKVFEELPDGKLSIYFFSSDTLNYYDWSEIAAGNKIIKRMDFTYDELENLKWTVTYP